MKQTIENFGACLNLALTGKPDEVSRRVNLLFNYGVISNVPESYEEGKDGCVMVQSDKGRMEKGFYALARVHLEKKKIDARMKSRKAFLEAVRLKASQYAATFEPIGTVYENPIYHASNIYGEGAIHDFGWTQTFSAQ